jgi:hypothetical protein
MQQICGLLRKHYTTWKFLRFKIVFVLSNDNVFHSVIGGKKLTVVNI